MAFASVRGTPVASSGTGTAASVGLPATVNSGDLLLVYMVTDNTPTVTCDNDVGTFTQEFDATAFSSCRGVLYAKVADGTEDSASLGFTLGSSNGWRARSYCIQDWEGTLAGGLDSATAVVTTSTTPDPPNLAPGWGSVDIMWFSLTLSDNNHIGGVTSYSTNYADNQYNEDGAGSPFCSLAFCTRELNASSEDPGVITWAAGTRNAIAATVAIHPAAVADVTGTGTPSVPTTTASGSGSVTAPDVSGTGTPSLTFPTASGSGSVTATSSDVYDVGGGVSLTINAVHTTAGSGTVFFEVTGTGAPSLPVPTASGTGLAYSTVTGTGAIVLGAVTVNGGHFTPLEDPVYPRDAMPLSIARFHDFIEAAGVTQGRGLNYDYRLALGLSLGYTEEECLHKSINDLYKEYMDSL